MLKLEFPNIKHKNLYENLLKDWDGRKAPYTLFCENSFDDFLDLVNRDLEGVEGRVSSNFYFLVDTKIENEIIGCIEIRHKIPKIKLESGETIEIGQIGYGISTKFRKKGYATKLLNLGLRKVKEILPNLDKILITCDTDNLGSNKVIENNNGILEKVDKRGKNRYQIYL